MKTNLVLAACSELKKQYNVNEIKIVRIIKESSISLCMETFFDSIHYFVKLSKTRSLIYDNYELYKYICLQTKSYMPIKNRQGSLYSTILGYKIIVFNWMNITNYSIVTKADEYIRFVLGISKKISSINIENYIENKYKKMYIKKRLSAFLGPDFYYKHVGFVVLEEIATKLSQINDYYMQQINCIKSLLLRESKLCLIHNDLNTTNIVMVEGEFCIIDFDSIVFGMPIEDIFMIAMDLLPYESVFNKFISFVKYSEKEILLGCILKVNQILRHIEKNQFNEVSFNKRYILLIINSLYYHIDMDKDSKVK